MAFPPVPAYPLALDSDRTLFLVHNTAEAQLTSNNLAWSQELEIEPVGEDEIEIWADNGFANISGELFYYDSVDKDGNGKVYRLKGCARNLGGKKTQHNAVGTWVRGFVIAEHHNQLAQTILNIEAFIGAEGSDDTLTGKIRALLDEPTCNDDHECPDIVFEFEVVTASEDACTPTIIEYDLEITGFFSNFRIDFGDGNFTTALQSGTHTYAPNATIDPIVTVTNGNCQIVQSSIERNNPSEPSIPTTTPTFEINLPEVPEFPTLVIPDIEIPSTTLTFPQFNAPCGVGVSPISGINIPSIIELYPPVPSIVQFEPISLPSIITFIDAPSFSPIDFGPAPSFAPIDFGPFPSFSPIDFGPAPSFAPIDFGPFPDFSPINFGPVYVPSLIFVIDNVPSNINVLDDIPSTINVNVSGGLPSTIQVNDDIPSSIQVNDDIPSAITVTVSGGLPSMISVVDNIPSSISVYGSFPSSISVDISGGVPSTITLVDTLPESIELIGSIPSTIELIGEIPSTIELIANFPSSIALEITGSLPSEITVLDTIPSLITVADTIPSIINIYGGELPSEIHIIDDIPDAISVTGFPDGIPVTGFPASIDVSGSVDVNWGSAPQVEVSWGTPPACSCTVTMSCPSSSGMAAYRRAVAKQEAGESSDYVDPFINMEIQTSDLGIPSEIHIIAPVLPNISIIHDIPTTIYVESPHIPEKIEIIGPEIPIPNEIRVVMDGIIPQQIELISDLPSSIILDASLIPSSIDLKFPDDLPEIKLLMPSEITVVGMPSVIEVKHSIPSEIIIKEPNFEIPLVFKGGPIPVKWDSLSPSGDNGDQPCFALVPCGK